MTTPRVRTERTEETCAKQWTRRGVLKSGLSACAASLAIPNSLLATSGETQRCRFRVGLDTFSYGLALGGYKKDYELRWPRMTIRQLLERAHAAGAEGIILIRGFVCDPERWGPRFLDEIKSRADELGMYLELGMGTPNKLGTAVEDAVRMGASIIRALVAPWIAGDRRNYKGNWQEMVDRAVVQLRSVAPKAAEHGIKIGLENHLDLTADELLEVVERIDSPQIGVCLDTGNSLGMMEDPLETAAKLAPHVVTTHVKDWKLGWTRRGYQFAACRMGEGVVDNASIFRLLAKTCPSLHVNIESPAFQRFEIPIFEDDFWRGLPDLKAAHLAKFLRFMKSTVGQARADDWKTPIEQGWSEEKLLAHEENLVRHAVAYARRELLQQTEEKRACREKPRDNLSKNTVESDV